MIDDSLRSCGGARRNGAPLQELRSLVFSKSCERPVKSGEQPCREIGASRKWTTNKQSEGPIFKACRRECKQRFAWIKTGRITDEQFYAWRRQAQEEKKKCDREIISLEEFQQ